MNRADAKHQHKPGQACAVWDASHDAFDRYIAEQTRKPYSDVAVARSYRAWKDASAEARRLCPDGPPPLNRK